MAARSRMVTIGFVVLVVGGLCLPAAGSSGVEVDLWFFWGQGCELCEEAEAWLDEFVATRPEVVIHSMDVWSDKEARQLYMDMMDARGRVASWVPGFIIGDEVWEGFNPPIAAGILGEVETRLAGGVYGGDEVDAPDAAPHPDSRTTRHTIDLGLFGQVEIQGQPLLAATLLVGLVDGFNPCSLWVLTVLLAMILNTRSRTRIALVGGTFLIVTALVYGVFITGLYTALAAASQLAWIRTAVALLALVFAAVSMKDFFAFGVGPSLTIPEGAKPAIFRGGREVTRERALPLTLAITVLFAAGVAIIELPCTAGLPVIWTGLLTEAGVSGPGYLTLLAVYLCVYLLVEIGVIAAALVTMRATRLQEVHGRSLKLIGGMVMAAIAVALLVDPAVMEGLAGSIYVVTGALAASALVIMIDRRRARS